MPKRKRGQQAPEPELANAGTSTNLIPVVPRPPSAEESARAIAQQQEVVEQKIYHGKILLKRALKTAKGFEQQKLGKRLKNARKDNGGGAEEEKRLEAELEALKTIDLAQLAAAHVHKMLKKSHQIANSAYFPPSVKYAIAAESKESSPSAARMNVAARMYNSNPVKEAMVEVLRIVRIAMEIEEDEPQVKPKQKQVESKSETQKKSVNPSITESDDTDGTDGDDESGGKDGEEEIDEARAIELLKKGLAAHPEASDDDSDDFSGDDRIALSDSEDETDVQRGRSMSITPISQSPSSSPSISRSSSPEPRQKSKLASVSLTKPTTSAFLPSLMSGYISGSSLSSEDDDGKSKSNKKKGPAQKKARNNRMGQQARRALAEKKYGMEAKHIKAEVDAKEERKQAKELKQKLWKERQERAVHPSWQASIKEKDEKTKVVKDLLRKSGNGSGAVIGKKIVFD